MNYTVIHGNVLYHVENVTHTTTDSERIFRRNGNEILIVPLPSTLIANGKGISMQVMNSIHPVPDASNNTTVINSNDNFVEGAIVGGIVGAVLF